MVGCRRVREKGAKLYVSMALTDGEKGNGRGGGRKGEREERGRGRK